MGEGNAYVTPLRDKQHGRIYRIVYKDAAPYQPFALDRDDPEGLVDALPHDNMFWRTTAQRLLVERGQQDVLPRLYDLVKDRRVDEIGLNGAALHALWTMHGLQALDGRYAEALDVARGALSHPAAGVRKAALQVLPRTEASLAALLAADVLHDPDLHTRLAAFLAVSEMPPSAEAGAALYEESKTPEVIDDVWLPQAIFVAAKTHRAGFAQAYQADAGAQVEQAVEAVPEPEIQKEIPIARQFLQHNPPEGEQGAALSAVDTPEDADVQTITVSVIKGELAFDKTTFTVEAGKRVRIVFENADLLQHNLLLLKPGTLDDVGQRADAMAADPQAPARHYVPDTPNVLFSTKMLDPNTTETLTFTAPAEPGDYPYVCTFPGHWRTMQGVMRQVAVKMVSAT